MSLLLLLACETPDESLYHSQLVVEGYLYAGEKVDSIVIRRTLPIDANTVESQETNAQVAIMVDGITHLFQHDTARPGVYVALDSFIAESGKTYHLRVTSGSDVATAETTIPQGIRFDSVKLEDRHLSLSAVDTIDFPNNDELFRPGIQLWWNPSPGSAGYAIEAVGFDTTQGAIIHDLNRDAPDTTARGRYRFLVTSATEQIIWLQFRYYGLNGVRALALDKNYQDLILGIYLNRSQFNNGTLHVNGGLGFFASAARASKPVYLRKKE